MRISLIARKRVPVQASAPREAWTLLPADRPRAGPPRRSARPGATALRGAGRRRGRGAGSAPCGPTNASSKRPRLFRRDTAPSSRARTLRGVPRTRRAAFPWCRPRWRSGIRCRQLNDVEGHMAEHGVRTVTDLHLSAEVAVATPAAGDGLLSGRTPVCCRVREAWRSCTLGVCGQRKTRCPVMDRTAGLAGPAGLRRA